MAFSNSRWCHIQGTWSWAETESKLSQSSGEQASKQHLSAASASVPASAPALSSCPDSDEMYKPNKPFLPQVDLVVMVITIGMESRVEQGAVSLGLLPNTVLMQKARQNS